MKILKIVVLMLLCVSMNAYAVPRKDPTSHNTVMPDSVEKLGLSNRIFITLVASKAQAYVGEQFYVNVKLYVDRLGVKDIVMPTLHGYQLSIVDFKEPKQYREKLNGTVYDVLEFRSAILGSKPGKYRLGPAVIKCVLVMPGRFSTDEYEDSRLLELKSGEIEIEVTSSTINLDFIASILGAMGGLVIGYLVAVPLRKRIVIHSINKKYNKLKKDSRHLTEVEIFIEIMKSRPMNKKISGEIISKILRKESVDNLSKLIDYISREEDAYMKQMFLKGSLSVNRDRMNALKDIE